jgi:hypothetical protein
MPEPIALSHLTFEAWTNHVFDHENPDWHWDLDEVEYDVDADPAETLAHLNRLFAEPQILLERFTDDQIGAGLHYLVNSSCSNTMFVYRDAELPLVERQAGIRSMAHVFERIFAARCHDRNSGRPLDTICFMWFDVCPIGIYHDGEALGDAIFATLRQILSIDNEPCQYAALHGLGENCHGRWRKSVAAIVDDYLARHPHLPKELREYARAARTGNVL